MLKFCLILVFTVSWAQAGFVSYDQFRKALTNNGYPAPSRQKYNNFNNYARSGGRIGSKQEAAMALAQFIHETGGLRFIVERKCAVSHCPRDYRDRRCDVPGKYYYGRGYIQLSWCYNYRDASAAIFGNPKVLLNDPDRVARDDSIAWRTAFWFWRDRVHNRPGVQQGHFGATTRAINGGECKPGNPTKARRFKIYGNVRRAFGLRGRGNPAGC